MSQPNDSVSQQMHSAIAEALPGASIQVDAHQPGHFSVSVVSSEFEGQSKLACQRVVYRAIAPLMAGPTPPVHAIDQMRTRLP